jgi:O-antigen/teichoic acid export membrane protein
MTDPEFAEPVAERRTSAADLRVMVKGSAVQFAGFGINRFASLAFVAVAVRFLSPAGYGLYRQVAQLLQMIGNMGPGGFDVAGLRWIAKARASNDPGGVRGAARVAFTGATLVSLSLGLAVFLAAAWIARGFADTPADVEPMVELLHLGAAFIPLYALMQVVRFACQGFKTNIPSVVAGNVVQPLSLVVVSLGGLALGWGVRGLIIGLMASAALGLVTALWFFHRIRSRDEKMAPAGNPIGPMVRFAIPQWGVTLFRIGGLGPHLVLLGLLSSDLDVGLFAIGNSLQGLALIFPQAILSLWAPMVADLHERGDMDRLGALYQTVTRWMASFSFLFIAALIIQPEFFVRVLAGSEAADAALLTSILALGTLFTVATGPCGSVITMTGYPVVNLANSVAGMGLYIGAALWLAPRYGALGMAGIDAGMSFLLNLARVLEAKYLAGIQPYSRTFLKPIGATLASSAVLLGWRFLPWEGLLWVVPGLLLACVVHFGVLWAGGIDPEDRFVWERTVAKLRSARPGREDGP